MAKCFRRTTDKNDNRLSLMAITQPTYPSIYIRHRVKINTVYRLCSLEQPKELSVSTVFVLCFTSNATKYHWNERLSPSPLATKHTKWLHKCCIILTLLSSHVQTKIRNLTSRFRILVETCFFVSLIISDKTKQIMMLFKSTRGTATLGGGWLAGGRKSAFPAELCHGSFYQDV